MKSVSYVLFLVLSLGACSSNGENPVDADFSDVDQRHDADEIDGDADVLNDADQRPDADVDVDSDQDSQPCRAPEDRRLRIFFVGNSFTLGGPIPDLVRDLAASAGWPTPEVDVSAVGGYELERHRVLQQTLDGIDDGDWDFVVLQEYSTRPTDNIGDPEQFKEDATWFYERIKASNENAMVVLYETWARHPDHDFYPDEFANPEEMQAQLRFHYNDAAEVYIPKHATVSVTTDVVVAPAGDAWEVHLAEENPLRLHGSDDYHAGTAGQYLNALVIYSTIYGCRTSGISNLHLDPDEAERLQHSADETTGETGISPVHSVPSLATGETVRVDFGENITAEAGWNNHGSVTGGVVRAITSDGESTGVSVMITDVFEGANASGLKDNGLGYPSTVSQDVLWTGSFDGHEAALSFPAQITVQDLDPGTYSIRIFASREGDDDGNGRLTRYTIGSAFQDLEVSNNRDREVTFENVVVSDSGSFVLDIEVSPDGSSRFAYIGALFVTRID